MDNFSKTKWLFLIFVLLLIVSSCTGVKSATSPKSSAETTTHAKQFMSEGEYQKAIDVYNIEYRRNPQDRVLLNEYVKNIEDIKSSADKASDREDFAPAGRKYHVLLKNYPRFKGFEKRLSFNSSHLHSRISHCKQSLSKQGFQEYRKGNLSGAIALWQGLLAIDPHNTEIKDAVRTAKLQQKNLQENK